MTFFPLIVGKSLLGSLGLVSEWQGTVLTVSRGCPPYPVLVILFSTISGHTEHSPPSSSQCLHKVPQTRILSSSSSRGKQAGAQISHVYGMSAPLWKKADRKEGGCLARRRLPDRCGPFEPLTWWQLGKGRKDQSKSSRVQRS